MWQGKYILTIVILIAVLMGSTFTITESQTTVGIQRWEYALLTVNLSKSEFSWNVSNLYESVDSEFAVDRNATQQVWDILASKGDAGLVDYLAVMGLTGYELVDVTNVQSSLFMYTFKRPA